MSLPADYVAKQGDVLLVPCTVYYDQFNPNENDIGVRIGDGVCTQFIDRALFADVASYRIESGDRVVYDRSVSGTILALTKTHGWVAFDDHPNEPQTVSRALLTREGVV